MADVTEKEIGYDTGSDSESRHTQHIFERPTGIRGAYSHPLTQVFVVTHRRAP
jgi:hypothetical protein